MAMFFFCLMMFPAQLEVYFFSLKSHSALQGIYFFLFRKVKCFKNANNIVYFIDSQVYGDNILQKF